MKFRTLMHLKIFLHRRERMQEALGSMMKKNKEKLFFHLLNITKPQGAALISTIMNRRKILSHKQK